MSGERLIHSGGVGARRGRGGEPASTAEEEKERQPKLHRERESARATNQPEGGRVQGDVQREARYKTHQAEFIGLKQTADEVAVQGKCKASAVATRSRLAH